MTECGHPLVPLWTKTIKLSIVPTLIIKEPWFYLVLCCESVTPLYLAHWKLIAARMVTARDSVSDASADTGCLSSTDQGSSGASLHSSVHFRG